MPSEIFLVGGGTIRVSDQPEAVQKSLGKERNGWVRLQTQGSDHDVWLRSEHVAGVVGVPDPGGHTFHQASALLEVALKSSQIAHYAAREDLGKSDAELATPPLALARCLGTGGLVGDRDWPGLPVLVRLRLMADEGAERGERGRSITA